jgi:hypothetical protein
MGSYDESIAVGRVLYVGNFPIVPQDECWIPALDGVGELHIKVSDFETDTNADTTTL